jgi:ABC-type lipoprotein release transport system permease subunit
MAAALYWWRASRRQTWRSTLVVVVLCGILGAAALGALAGARRTESAYGRYLVSINASDVMVNIPLPDTSLIAKVEGLPGIRASAAWLGLNANPVVHGRVDLAFQTDNMAGGLHGEFVTQDVMTVVKGRLPRPGAADEVALTAGLAHLFGVGVGGTVTYQFLNSLKITNVVTGYSTYRVVGIVELPPVLVDQFDQVQGAILPQAATVAALHHRNAVEFSWVALRLDKGSAGIPALQASLAHLAAKVGGGVSFAIRSLETVHEQVQEAIRPQAVALAVFGVAALLALLVLLGQSLAQLLDRTAGELETLRALGLSRARAALTAGLGGAAAVVAGMALAVAGAVALSPLAPVGPVHQVDPARGFRFDLTVLLGGGLLLTVVLLVLVAWLAWRSVRPLGRPATLRPSLTARAAGAVGLPTVATLGARYALEAPPGRRRGTARANVLGSIAAVTAVVTAVVFGASLNGLVSHPVRYGWNWDVLIQEQGGYGNFQGFNLSKLVDSQPGVQGWSTFAFAQLPIDGQSVPVLGLATHRGSVEPPTISGRSLDGPNQIELGLTTLHQLGKQVGDVVRVGIGSATRPLTIVGTATLPSLGLQLTDHVSLGRGAVLPESTLLAVERLAATKEKQPQSITSLPSTLAMDLKPGVAAGPIVRRIVAAEPGGQPGGTYQVHRVLGAAIVNASQMGGQPLTLAIVLAAAVVLSLAATVVAGARRRRRELGIVKALGLTRRQVRAVIAWQTSTILVIAAVFGLPLGIAVGRWAWTAFATSIGVVPVTVVPLLALVLGLLGLVIAGNALTAFPAVRASHAPTAAVLHGE